MKLKLIKKKSLKSILLFSFAEFTLVILGILIALKIDNWNEKQKDIESELGYLRALKKEFNDNLAILQNIKSRNQDNIKYASIIAKATHPNKIKLSDFKFDSLSVFLFKEVQYRPSSGVKDALISSGNLELITNKDLKYSLAAWDKILQAIRFQEKEHAKFRNNIIALINRKINARKMLQNSLGSIEGITASQFNETNRQILNDMEYDNQLISFIITAKVLNLQYYPKLELEMQSIINTLDQEIKKDKDYFLGLL